MTLPNFLIIGAQKSGTSALHAYLNQHPQIFMSPMKELHFLSWGEDRFPDFRGPNDQKFFSKYVIRRFDDYAVQFAARTTELAVGESSPSYMTVSETIAQIKRYVPQARLIAILRNPVDRAYSGYMTHVRDGYEPLHEFGFALLAEDQRIKDHWSPGWHYCQRGLYYAQLRPYFEAFQPVQLKTFLYDDFINDPFGLMRDLFDFLQVDNTFVPDMKMKRNISGFPRHLVWQRLLKKPRLIHWLLKPFMRYRQRVQLIYQLRIRNLDKPPMDTATRRDLIDFFRPDILNLQDLIQRDLSPWLRVGS